MRQRDRDKDSPDSWVQTLKSKISKFEEENFYLQSLVRRSAGETFGITPEHENNCVQCECLSKGRHRRMERITLLLNKSTFCVEHCSLLNGISSHPFNIFFLSQELQG